MQSKIRLQSARWLQCNRPAVYCNQRAGCNKMDRQSWMNWENSCNGRIAVSKTADRGSNPFLPAGEWLSG